MESAPSAEAEQTKGYEFTSQQQLLADIALTQDRVNTCMNAREAYRKQGLTSNFEHEDEVILSGLIDRMVELRAVAAAKDVDLYKPAQAEPQAAD